MKQTTIIIILLLLAASGFSQNKIIRCKVPCGAAVAVAADPCNQTPTIIASPLNFAIGSVFLQGGRATFTSGIGVGTHEVDFGDGSPPIIVSGSGLNYVHNYGVSANTYFPTYTYTSPSGLVTTWECLGGVDVSNALQVIIAQGSQGWIAGNNIPASYNGTNCPTNPGMNMGSSSTAGTAGFDWYINGSQIYNMQTFPATPGEVLRFWPVSNLVVGLNTLVYEFYNAAGTSVTGRFTQQLTYTP